MYSSDNNFLIWSQLDYCYCQCVFNTIAWVYNSCLLCGCTVVINCYCSIINYEFTICHLIGGIKVVILLVRYTGHLTRILTSWADHALVALVSHINFEFKSYILYNNSFVSKNINSFSKVNDTHQHFLIHIQIGVVVIWNEIL